MIFNPRSVVTDTVSAGDVVAIVETSSGQCAGQGKGDAQFAPQGRDFIAWCLLAAAKSDGKSDGTMKDVLRWMSSADFI